MQVELSAYEVHLLQAVLEKEIKDARQLRARMDSNDPFRQTMGAHIDWLSGLLAKLEGQD